MPVVAVTIDLANFSDYPAMGADEAGMAIAQRSQTNLFLLGGSLWTVAKQQLNSPFPFSVYKSIDSGATWTAIDNTNAPPGTVGVAAVAVKVFGTRIYVLYLNGTGGGVNGLRVASFDTATELWGTETGNVPSTDTAGGHDVRIFDFHATAADTFNVVYTDNLAGVFTTYLVQHASSVWAAAIAIGTDITAPMITGYFVDVGTATAHLTYSQRMAFGASPISPNVVRHLTINAAGTVSASDVLIADALQHSSAGANFTWPAFGVGVLFGGNIVLPFANVFVTQQYLPAVMVGSAGTYSQTTFGTFATDEIRRAGGAWTYALVSGGTLYILWCTDYFDDLGNPIRQIRYVTSTDGTTFTTPATLYDFAIDPPPDSDPSSTIYDISAAFLAAGVIGATVTVSDLSFDSIRRFLGLMVAPAALTIECGSPPDGAIGVPYNHTLPVSGGTAPYTFSLLSGSLPSGLTLNTVTGVISGTPLAAGISSFTVRVTDAALATADVTCSITITGAPLTLPVPIHNIWESGLARGNELSATMIRLAGADVWVRGEGPLEVTVYGPDKVLNQTPQLLLASGVPATALTPNPGIMYALKLDFRQIENFTIRYETNALGAWFELSGFRTYTKSDLFNR